MAAQGPDALSLYFFFFFQIFNAIELYFFFLNLWVLIYDAIGVVVGQEREIQKNYWAEHSVDLTVEAMMLDSKAADLDKEERPEVISLFSWIWCAYF